MKILKNKIKYFYKKPPHNDGDGRIDILAISITINNYTTSSDKFHRTGPGAIILLNPNIYIKNIIIVIFFKQNFLLINLF